VNVESGSAPKDWKLHGEWIPSERRLRLVDLDDETDGAITFLHELAHAVDHNAGVRDGIVSEDGMHSAVRLSQREHWTAFRAAIAERDGLVYRLESRRMGYSGSRLEDVPVRYAAYLADPMEVWARAVPQVIAERAGRADLVDRHWSYGESKGHWTAEEWPRIRAAVEAALKAEGMIE
jgi:hypothetical protein